MGVSLLHADDTSLANRDVQGIGSANIDNSKSLINIDKVIPIDDNMKDTNCILAIREKLPKVMDDADVHEHNTKDIDLDTINTSRGSSNGERKHLEITKGGDTDSEVEGAHSENEVQRTIDTQCQANDGDGCYLESGDHRKVVSQYFGRNKRCTQLLADDLWLVWCRKHYQQRRYNLQQEGIWHLKKLELVRHQIERFKDIEEIAGWDIALHKTEQVRLNKENAAAVTLGAEPPASPVWERFLEPYLGFNKSYAELDVVLRVIEAEFQTTAFVARNNKAKEMPAIEFLPIFPKGTAGKPLVKRKNRALVPHVKTKGKTLISNSVSRTVTPEFNDKTATPTIIQMVDKVPVSLSSPCKRKASSPMPLDEDSWKRLVCSSNSRPDPLPSNSAADAVFTSLSSHRKRQASSPTRLNNPVSGYPNKRRRLVQGIRPKMVHIKIEETEE